MILNWITRKLWNTFYKKMTIYKLKEVLDSQYNRSDVKRYHRSVLFLIQNTATGNQSLYEIDRIAKHSDTLRCIEKNVEQDYLSSMIFQQNHLVAIKGV